MDLDPFLNTKSHDTMMRSIRNHGSLCKDAIFNGKNADPFHSASYGVEGPTNVALREKENSEGAMYVLGH